MNYSSPYPGDTRNYIPASGGIFFRFVDISRMFQYFEIMTEEKPKPKPTGRPSKYSDEVRDEICSRLAMGESLRNICKDEHLPERRTVHRWIIENIGEEVVGDTVISEGFCHHYTRARDLGLDEMADDLLDIADDGTNDWMEKEFKDGGSVTVLNKEAVMRSRLRVDTRKWYLSKMAPKRYGNEKTIRHQQLDGDGEPTDPVESGNVHAQEIADAVEREMKRVIEAKENGNPETSA